MKKLVFLVYQEGVCAKLIDKCPKGVSVSPDDETWEYKGKTYRIGTLAEHEIKKTCTTLSKRGGGLSALRGQTIGVYNRTITRDLNHILGIVRQLFQLWLLSSK